MGTDLAFVPSALLPGKARHTGGLWANRCVSYARPLTHRTISTARSSPRYFLALHPSTKPRTVSNLRHF